VKKTPKAKSKAKIIEEGVADAMGIEPSDIFATAFKNALQGKGPGTGGSPQQAMQNMMNLMSTKWGMKMMQNMMDDEERKSEQKRQQGKFGTNQRPLVDFGNPEAVANFAKLDPTTRQQMIMAQATQTGGPAAMLMPAILGMGQKGEGNGKVQEFMMNLLGAMLQNQMQPKQDGNQLTMKDMLQMMQFMMTNQQPQNNNQSEMFQYMMQMMQNYQTQMANMQVNNIQEQLRRVEEQASVNPLEMILGTLGQVKEVSSVFGARSPEQLQIDFEIMKMKHQDAREARKEQREHEQMNTLTEIANNTLGKFGEQIGRPLGEVMKAGLQQRMEAPPMNPYMQPQPGMYDAMQPPQYAPQQYPPQQYAPQAGYDVPAQQPVPMQQPMNQTTPMFQFPQFPFQTQAPQTPMNNYPPGPAPVQIPQTPAAPIRDPKLNKVGIVYGTKPKAVTQ
jgi:hypothetical protein